MDNHKDANPDSSGCSKVNRTSKALLILILGYSYMLINNSQSFAQNITGESSYRIMFYNVENLFDPFHDTLKKDYEFVAGGPMGWTWRKFEKKLNNVSKVIINAGQWQPPEIVAFSEIENRNVLIHLIKRTPLERFGYKIIHEESPDERGIDVGLIYLQDKFKELSHCSIKIKSGDSLLKTRSILYVKGLMINDAVTNEKDTLHLFVNHWPSRTGGIEITSGKRKAAAFSLKRPIDSILSLQPNALIVLTGDFNDEPTDESLAVTLGASLSAESPANDVMLFNLMTPFVDKYDVGTNKFREQWGVIDQFIVSRALINNHERVKVEKAEILAFPFLLKVDEKYSGTVPFRTFSGMRYIGGFSDHLPVLLTLTVDSTI